MNQVNQLLQELEAKLKLHFINIDLLRNAITHSSFANQHRGKLLNNERLEFLGDAALKLIISDYLFQKYPQYNEGKLTKLRASIVSDKTLSQLAFKLNLEKFILMSDAEKRSDGHLRLSTLANALEAILGAIYLDQGLIKVRDFFTHLLETYDANLLKPGKILDYKSALQELLQGKHIDLPQYQIIREDGPDHKKIFHVKLEITISTHLVEVLGIGVTKKSAEQQAAKKAYKAIQTLKH